MLPGVDDGSDSMDTSLLMASMAAESGVETVIVTPHCNIPGEAANYPSRELLGRFMALRETIDAAKIPLRILAGAEVFCTADIAELIRAKLPKGCFFCVLTPEGKLLSSEQLADTLRQAKGSGRSSACFLIGSSFGIAPEIKKLADIQLSMSKMTFPHHLARVMALEQLYRAEAIQAGSKYHK